MSLRPKKELFERAIQIYEAQLEDSKMSLRLSKHCLAMLRRELAKFKTDNSAVQ